LPYNELWLDQNFRHVLSAIFDQIKKSLRCDFTHLLQRLTHGGERRICLSRGLNVVEPNLGNVFWHE